MDLTIASDILAALLSYKLNREYSEMCGFVQVVMSLAIVRSNSLLLRSPRDNGARIRQQPELTDGAVMALIAPFFHDGCGGAGC